MNRDQTSMKRMNWKKTVNLWVVGAAVVALAAVVAAHNPGYTITDIGMLAGGGASGATGINNAGQVVGWSENSAGDRRAVFWHDGILDKLPTPAETVSSIANAINDAGVIVGSVTFTDGTEHAAMWVNGQFTDLSDFAGLGIGEAERINRVGIIVGGSIIKPLNESRAIAWVNGVPSIIGTLSGNSAALDINEKNDIVGWAEDSNGDKHAFLYENAQQSMNDLGVMPDGLWSVATGINESGVIVGYGEVVGETTGVFSFKRDPQTGVMENLGALGSDTSHAFDVNEVPYIVGSSVLLGTGDLNAVLWRPDKMVNLNSLLLPGSHWDYLIEAKAINDEGLIVGRGVINDEVHGFILEPVLGMVNPIPGNSSEMNRFDAAGASPGNTVYFVYGFAWGQTNIPGCPGKILNIKNPKILATKKADQIGHAIVDLMVPKAAKNVAVIFQAVEPDTCEVSAPISWTFH